MIKSIDKEAKRLGLPRQSIAQQARHSGTEISTGELLARDRGGPARTEFTPEMMMPFEIHQIQD
ncbi:MAG: hypothetical protein R6U27_01640 [Desulfobacterales bacterium]